MIPKEFILFASKYMVEMNNKKCQSLEALGVFLDDERYISLADISLSKHNGTSRNVPLNREVIEDNYFHELAHCLLKLSTGNSKIWLNEFYVDNLGRLLRQYLITQKGDLFAKENK
jgi:hypothetical protein